jgi:serine/threonine-protein kinase
VDSWRSPILKYNELLEGKYRILRRIGRGGMAEVYAAHHDILQQTVALKVLLPEVADSPEATSRFLNEARAAARIRGENIATVMDVGSLENGTPFMVLEYLEGRDLEAYANEHGALPPSTAVDFVLQALQALAQAHALGIIHRDIKPSNLFLARFPDGTDVVKVLDFGISKASRALGPKPGRTTSTQSVMGSPLYMSPEQARSTKSVDVRTDIWSIGVTLYRLISGELPFHGETPLDVMLVIAQKEPRPLTELKPEVPKALEAIILRCLRKQPAERFSSVAELASALQPFGGPDAARVVARVCGTLGVTNDPTNEPAPILPEDPDQAASVRGVSATLVSTAADEKPRP